MPAAAKAICKNPMAASSRARLRDPASMMARPLPAKALATASLASLESEAKRTVVWTLPAINPVFKVAAKVVLKPLTTDASGRALAIWAAAELSAGTTRLSKVLKSKGLVMSTTILPLNSPLHW